MSDYYSKELTTKEILSILKKLRKQGLQKVAISGGEPLLRRDLFKILDACPDNISILTNALLLDKDLLEKFINFKERTNKIIVFRVSLDGLESNEKMRGYSYKKVIEQLKKIKEAGFIVVINTTISPFVQSKELIKMLILLEQLKVNQWNVDLPFNEGSFRKNRLSINLEQVLNELRNLIITYLDKKINMRLDIIGLFCSERIKRNLGFYECDLDSHPCNYQLHSMTINPSGEILLCPSLHLSFGNIKNLEDYRSLKKWKEFISKKREYPEGCKNCRYIKICGGGCRANAFYTTGKLWGKDELSCKLMEFLEKKILPHYPLVLQNQFKRLLLYKIMIKNYSFKTMGSLILDLFLKIYPKNYPLAKKMAYDEEKIKNHISTKVALDNQKIIGQANIFILDEKQKIANLGYHINPDFRRRGIGEALAQAAISEAKTKGIQMLVIQTERENIGAIALAKKLGFISAPKEFLKENRASLHNKSISNLSCLYKKLS